MVQLRYTGDDTRELPEPIPFPGRSAERTESEGDELTRMERTLDRMKADVGELLQEVEDALRPIPFSSGWRDDDDLPPSAA